MGYVILLRNPRSGWVNLIGSEVDDAVVALEFDTEEKAEDAAAQLIRAGWSYAIVEAPE